MTWLTSAVSYHGGGFALGGPQHIFTGHVAYLQERGYAIVALEYRMAPQCVSRVKAADISVKFDVIREDIADGYQWVLETLPKLENIDPKRVFVMGGSAGGASTLIAVRYQPGSSDHRHRRRRSVASHSPGQSTLPTH